MIVVVVVVVGRSRSSKATKVKRVELGPEDLREVLRIVYLDIYTASHLPAYMFRIPWVECTYKKIFPSGEIM